jgi:hypothetical protein
MGKRDSKKTLLLVAVIVLGIYVLPMVTARIGNSHVWQFNRS